MRGLRITRAELEGYRHQGRGKRSGRYLRYFCPIHGSDHQRSFSLDPETGHFRCFSCEAWGKVVETLEELTPRRTWRARTHRAHAGERCAPRHHQSNVQGEQHATPKPHLERILAEYEAALPGSPGEAYLERRGIPLELARAMRAGYAPQGRWPQRTRDWEEGRLVFPHTNERGQVVNLYGRAVELTKQAPKELRHAHLSGPKGLFNAEALKSPTVYICEGVFDALSLMAAGYTESVALFGLTPPPWQWVRAATLVLCFDADAGRKARELAFEARLALGKTVYVLTADDLGGHKDLNEAYLAGVPFEFEPHSTDAT
jgi:DNA primase